MTLARGPADDAAETAATDEFRPARPAAVELAGAILIVSGILGLVGAIGAAPGLPAGTEVLFVVTALLNLGSLAIGLLARFGRAWLVAVNYVAVLGFLDLAAAVGSGLALLLGVADVIVVVILLLNKPWFDAMRRWRTMRASRRRVPSPPVGGG